MTSTSALAWRVRSRVPAGARTYVRRAVDAACPPFLGSVVGVRTTEPVLGLTFDDGPDEEGTPAVLDALSRHGVTATFFMLAERAERHADLVRAVAEAGHEIALHGMDHSRLAALPRAECRRRLLEAKRRLEAVSGTKVFHFRPPFGAQSVSTLRAARGCGLTVVVWSAYAEDWLGLPPSDLADRALAGVRPGGVLLLHDAYEFDLREAVVAVPTIDRTALLDELLPALSNGRGYRLLPVAGLLAAYPARRTAWFRP